MQQKIVLAVISAISVALIGATTTSSINLVQETFAFTKNCDGPDAHNCWCYFSGNVGLCTTSKGDCIKAQRSDDTATSGCFKK